jgi:ribonuclease M5
MEKIKIDMPVIVEGRYDKITLSAVLDAHIIPTDGFAIFNRKDKLAMIRRLADERGVIVLTDADGAGQLIRAHISSALPKDKVIHLYTPAIEGKEKRKAAPSKEGYLGVEGMEAERLASLFRPFAGQGVAKKEGRALETRDLYADGLSGGACAAKKRELLAAKMDLPHGLSAPALLAAINLLYTYEEYKSILSQCKEDPQWNGK